MFLDVYVLVPSRERGTLDRFLSEFASGFREATDEYPYPQYADEHSFIEKRLDSLLNYLFSNENAEYGIYFTSRERRLHQAKAAMTFFTADSSLILGLTVPVGFQDDALRSLKDAFGCKYGLVVLEEPPPSTASEFMRLASS